jgi:hypothetical protein
MSSEIINDWTSDELINDKQKTFLDALALHYGNVTKACQATRVGRRTHYDWTQQNESYKTYVNDISETKIDFVEDKLKQNIESGDTTAIIFFLKTKGKGRGYIEKTEQDLNLRNAPSVIDWLNGTKEENEQ